MFRLKSLNLLLIMLTGILFLMGMSCICAADVDHSTAGDGNGLELPQDNSADFNNANGYLDLKNDIEMLHTGDTYDLTKDYSFEKWDSRVRFNYGIDVYCDNVTINGNGHTIDGNNVSSIFNIHGNNVVINNVTIVNGFSPFKSSSPIVWEGNNGIFSDSIIKDSTAPIGGAVKWTGNNGLIDNVEFINCTAKYVGGALYLGGTNNTVNSIFLNCTSAWSGEAIYIDRNRQNCTVSSYTDNEKYLVVDGKYTGIDICKFADLHRTYPIVGDLVDVMPILYKTFTYGGVNNLNEHTLYSGWYVNATEFVLTFTRNYDNNVTYQKNLYFHDVNRTDDVFWELYTGKFDYDHKLVKEINITNIDDYEDACKLSADKNIFQSELSTLFGQSDSLVKALKVNFAGTYYFESKSMWDLNNPNVDVVVIKGNGSTISGNTKASDTYKWASVGADKYFALSDLTIKRFNTAFENLGGHGFLTNVTISDNKMNYLISRDWGAGILNAGECHCNNCTFSNNYAKNGGAIFNQGKLFINNSTFTGNIAYNDASKVNHKGNDICVGDGGTVVMDGENITKDTEHVFFAKSISSGRETLVTVVTIAGAFVAGVAAGIITFNPVVGFAVGAVVGAGIGAVGAGLIISSHFDINYNRAATCACLMICGAVSGGFGGLAGYYATTAGTSAAAASQQSAAAGQGASNSAGQTIVGNSVKTIKNGEHVQHVVHLNGPGKSGGFSLVNLVL